MNSLDPRVTRLPKTGQPGEVLPKAPLDQFNTFEVFVRPKAGKPFQHEGAVHAPDLEMAFILAKETFTRRFTCASLCVTDTTNVIVSAFTEGTRSAYELVQDPGTGGGRPESYEIFHLLKRGKQHIHAATVLAASPQEAMWRAKNEIDVKPVFNIWAVRTSGIRFTSADEQDLWHTLPEKKFRDAGDYKGGEKLKSFLDQRQS